MSLGNTVSQLVLERNARAEFRELYSEGMKSPLTRKLPLFGVNTARVSGKNDMTVYNDKTDGKNSTYIGRHV